jgi:hypothetical protein
VCGSRSAYHGNEKGKFALMQLDPTKRQANTTSSVGFEALTAVPIEYYILGCDGSSPSTFRMSVPPPSETELSKQLAVSFLLVA